MDKCGAFDCVSSSQTDDWLAIKSQIRNTQSVSIFPNQHTRIHSKSYLFNSQSQTYIYWNGWNIFCTLLFAYSSTVFCCRLVGWIYLQHTILLFICPNGRKML